MCSNPAWRRYSSTSRAWPASSRPRQIATALVQKQRFEKLITTRAAGAQHARDLAQHRDRLLQILHRDADHRRVDAVVVERQVRVLVQVLHEPAAEARVRRQLGCVHAVADDLGITDLRRQMADPAAHQIEQHAALPAARGDRNRSARRPRARRYDRRAAASHRKSRRPPRRSGGRRRPATRDRQPCRPPCLSGRCRRPCAPEILNSLGQSARAASITACTITWQAQAEAYNHRRLGRRRAIDGLIPAAKVLTASKSPV